MCNNCAGNKRDSAREYGIINCYAGVAKAMGIHINFSSIVGKTSQIAGKTYQFYGKDGAQIIPISWKSSNNKIATVTRNGAVKGINSGKVKITGTVGGKSKSINVSVKMARPKITVKKSGNSKIHVKWKKVYGADKCIVYVKEAGKNWQKVETLGASYRGLKINVAKGKKYYVKVKAYDKPIKTKYYRTSKAKGIKR